MQMICLNDTLGVNATDNASVFVNVPDDYALVPVPKGRGSLACWLADLPNGSIIRSIGDSTFVEAEKVNGHFDIDPKFAKDLDRLATLA